MRKILTSPIALALLFVTVFVASEVFGFTNVAVTIQVNTQINYGLVSHTTFDALSSSVGQAVPGRLGQAASFDGASDSLSLGDLGTVQTVAFWIKTGDTTSQKIIDIDGTDQIELNGSSQITATSFPGTVATYVDGVVESTISTDWHHVVITDTTGVDASAAVLGVVASGYFDGVLDDVRFYDRVLPVSQIKRLYELGATTKISTSIFTNPELDNGLISHWTFDSGSGIDHSQSASVRDRISSNHGTPYVMGNLWPNDWDYRVPIVIQSSQVSSTLSSFPVYVDLSDMPASFFSNVQSDGDDIRVMESDGSTETPFELVSINTASSTGELYLKADSITDAEDTTFYIYYGNASVGGYAITDTYGAENVWVGYDMVHHLEDSVADATSGGVLDSTSNDQDGTPDNFSDGGGGATGATAKFGNGSSFAGDDDAIDLGSFTPSSAGTVSFWFNMNSTKLQRPYGGDDRYEFRFDASGNVTADFLVAGGAGASAGNITTTGTWFHLVTTYDDSSDTVRTFVDGAFVDDKTDSDDPMGGPYTTYLGRSASAQYFDGLLDEVRVSSSVRSDQWIETENNNMASPDTFYTAGSQESAGIGNAYANTASGRLGQGLEFAVLDFVNISGEFPIVNLGNDSSLDLSFPLTISTWVHLSADYTYNGGMIIGKGSEDDDSVQWSLFMQQSGVPYFVKVRSDKATPDAAFASVGADENRWVHYVFTADASGGWVFYADGEEDATGTFPDLTIATTTGPGYMGAYYRSAVTSDINSGLWGVLDDVRLYNRALSPEEVVRLYGLGGTAHIGVTNDSVDGVGGRGLINHWTFDGVEGIDLGQSEAEIRDRVGSSHGAFGETIDISNAVPGKIGQGIAFDGVGESIDFGNASSCVDGGGLSYCPETISFWIKANDITSRPIMELASETSIDINGSSQITTSGFAGSPTIYVDGEVTSTITGGWHHVVITDIPELGAFKLGFAGEGYFSGVLDDIRVFDYILSAEEIARLSSL